MFLAGGLQGLGSSSPCGSADTSSMTISSDTTTDLEPTALVRDDNFWRPDHDAAPQDWVGYLGLEDDPSGSTIEDSIAAVGPPESVDPYASLASPLDDLLPGR